MTRHTPTRKRAQHGFTLFEVLAAMSLFAIVGLGMAQFAAQSFRHTSDNRASTGAVMLAQQELEDQRALDYVDIASRTYTATDGNQGYNVNTVVTDDTPAVGMKQLTVTVSWSGPIGSRSYVVQAILTAVN